MPVKTGPKLLRDRLIFSFLAQHHAPSVGGSSLFHGNTTNSGKPTPEATTGWEATASRSSEDSTGSKTGLWPLLRALAQCSPERGNGFARPGALERAGRKGDFPTGIL